MTMTHTEAGSLVPSQEEYECRMRVFTLIQGVLPIASGVVFTDGRVAVVHRSGREEQFPSLDQLMSDYVGMAGLVWADRESDWSRVPRRFVFHRHVDSSNFSGTGVAMEGAQFPDGRVVLTWLGPYRSLVHWPSIEQAVTVHGHGGDTVLRWLDETENRFAA